jgi:hypothetical protein
MSRISAKRHRTIPVWPKADIQAARVRRRALAANQCRTLQSWDHFFIVRRSQRGFNSWVHRSNTSSPSSTSLHDFVRPEPRCLPAMLFSGMPEVPRNWSR